MHIKHMYVAQHGSVNTTSIIKGQIHTISEAFIFILNIWFWSWNAEDMQTCQLGHHQLRMNSVRFNSQKSWGKSEYISENEKNLWCKYEDVSEEVTRTKTPNFTWKLFLEIFHNTESWKG